MNLVKPKLLTAYYFCVPMFKQVSTYKSTYIIFQCIICAILQKHLYDLLVPFLGSNVQGSVSIVVRCIDEIRATALA